ncbi:hypothetical protein [Aestuariibaculum suncheonense]|uniref:Uncharacterized protein n=1 Tax=Aestuariibaculum suncheonense TaxID=1028745 RepID=A0A8J6QGE5_9FLAO|nr:hypothetical protein [Aestuariibaculum suncheonense]MBD0835056.1 hypothetical protein [Aestuariibaculum suncheonense]
MLKISNLKITTKLWALLGFVLLLLLSPCKVRNFIQDELGVPKTEISNKNKTTFNPSCDTSDVVLNSLNKDIKADQSVPAILTPFEFTLTISNLAKDYSSLQDTETIRVSPIPLYILYRNFKDYL